MVLMKGGKEGGIMGEGEAGGGRGEGGREGGSCSLSFLD